jgi:ATP-dependent DNA helicase RecG
MTDQDLQRILAGESNSVEWKAGGDPEKIVKTLAAFANDYEGAGIGYVACGVEEQRHDDGRSTPNVVGISGGEARKLRDRIFELCHSLVTPPISPRFESVALDEERQVLVAWIAASSEVHTFKKAVVIRLGDKVTNATVPQHSELVQRKAHLDWLDQPCPGAMLDDIDFFALEEISKGLKPNGGAREFLEPESRMFGSAPSLTARITSPMGDVVTPKRFAMLLIGKEPQRFLRGAFVAVTRFQGLTRADAVFSSNEFFGPIQLLVDRVMGVLEVEASMVTDKNQDFLSGAQNRWRYSRQALQEILVNALAHRDYRDHLSTKISIFPNRIEFESPGGLMDLELAAMRQGRTRWRNPSLARYLVELGLAQERGTGIPKAIEQTLAVAGAEPTFEADSWLKVTVPAYQLPARQSAEEAVSPEAGALIVSIGEGTIDVGAVRRTHLALNAMPDERVLVYQRKGRVTAAQWPELIRDLRNWLWDAMEDRRFQEYHLFYRGPVAAGPLIGSMAVGRKPLVVYYYDEEASLYWPAYRLDRRLRQER